MVACFAIASITILPSAFQVTSSSNVDTLTQSLPSSSQLTKWWSVETSTETDSEDKSNEDQGQEDPSGKPWMHIRNTTHYTGYRYVNKLVKCVPNKVSSSANREIYDQWKQLPVSNSASSETRFSYAVIRDPLGRLYSGYWNKCLHSSSEEDHCVHFKKQRQTSSNGNSSSSSSTNPPPPTFLQFLQRNYLKDKFHKLHQNSHYQPIVKLCRHQNIKNTTLQQSPQPQQQQQQQQHELLSTYDHVFDMSSPDYNDDMNDFWKRVGAPHKIVDAFFPTTERRKLSWYHSGSFDATNVMHSYTQNNTDTSCQTLQLAMLATSDDYNYASQYFPKPQWAASILNGCPEFNDSIVVDTYYSTYNGTSDEDVVVEDDDTKTLRHLRKRKAELTSRIAQRHNDHHNDVQRKKLRVKMREKVLSKLRIQQSLENEEGVMVMLL
jgi:hypothetical protein